MKVYSKVAIFEKIDAFLLAHPDGVLEILGPTASGKTDFSVEVALRLGNAEVISVDSRQVFRDINVSSAKITEEEMKGVVHHGLDLVGPDESFSVYDFQQYCFGVVDEIRVRGNVPILCGGTMLWLDSVSENYVFSFDGKKSDKKGKPRFPVLKIGIYWDREVLYERINRRSVLQFSGGMIEECVALLKKYKFSKSAFTSFGYREVLDMLEGRSTRDEALRLNQRRNRNYAKRQETWWRGRGDVVWVSV